MVNNITRRRDIYFRNTVNGSTPAWQIFVFVPAPVADSACRCECGHCRRRRGRLVCAHKHRSAQDFQWHKRVATGMTQECATSTIEAGELAWWRMRNTCRGDSRRSGAVRFRILAGIPSPTSPQATARWGTFSRFITERSDAVGPARAGSEERRRPTRAEASTHYQD